jgi:transcription initiation factor IIF auxiliary subunit
MKYGWGAFRIGITIYWKDRFNEKFRKVYHDLLFVPLKQATLNLILTIKKP